MYIIPWLDENPVKITALPFPSPNYAADNAEYFGLHDAVDMDMDKWIWYHHCGIFGLSDACMHGFPLAAV